VGYHFRVLQMKLYNWSQTSKQNDNAYMFADKVAQVNHTSQQNMLNNTKTCFPKHKRDIFVIISIEDDSSIDSLKPKILNVLNPEFMYDEFLSEDFKDSLCILTMLMFSLQRFVKK